MTKMPKKQKNSAVVVTCTVPRVKINLFPTIGFGVPATTDPHHFIVHIPKDARGAVKISESLGVQAQDRNTVILDRVTLERSRWTAIRNEVQRAFNARLKEHKLMISAWKIGDNLVDRLLGKELCVLAWAIKGIKPENITIAIRNWLALRPEELWWLFGMAVMSTNENVDDEKGWRLALRHALGDAIQTEVSKPSAVKTKTKLSEPYYQQLSIFD